MPSTYRVVSVQPTGPPTASTSAPRRRWVAGNRPTRTPRRCAAIRASAADDLDAADVLSAMESFHEDEIARFDAKTAARKERDDVFKGTMDEEDVFERVDKQKARRREKRTAVRRAQQSARGSGESGAKNARLAFLYDAETDEDDATTVTKCNDVVRLCESMEEVLDVVREMRDAGVEPVESTYVAVMLVCRKIGAPERAIQVYDAMVEAEVSMSARTFYLVIELALKAGAIKEALRIKDDMKYMGLRVGAKLYTDLLRALANTDMGKRKGPQDRLIRACRLFEEMLGEGVNPPPAAYHTLIVAAHRANQHDLAIRTYEELIETGVTPTRVTCETALESMAKSGLIGRALDVFLDMKKNGLAPRKATYNMLLSACVHAPQPRVEEVFEIFEEMQANDNVSLDKTTFTLLIDTACKAGKPEMAFEAFAKMRESGVEVEVATLNRLIHAAGLNAKHDETSVQASLELYEAMKRLNVTPDVITYGSIISTCAKARDAATAVKMYKEMLANGIEPNRILFNVLISALGRADRRDDALKYFAILKEKAKKNSALKPNRETYTTVFDAIIGSGGVELAVAKHSLESGNGVSFVHSPKVATLRSVYAEGVAEGVYEDLDGALAVRDPDSASCTINMNTLSRTESVVATLVLLERLEKLKEENIPTVSFLYAGKGKPGKGGAQRRMLAIETCLRAADLKFEVGEVGGANLLAIKGRHVVKWAKMNAETVY